MEEVKDWLINARPDVSRRQFLAGASVAGASLAGFAIAAEPVAAQVISTPTEGLVATEGKVRAGDFEIPIYEARPAAAGRYPVVLVVPEAFGMHEHIKDIARRFAKLGYVGITFEPYAREGGVLQLPDIQAIMKVINAVPDARVMADLDAIVAYAKQHPSAQADRVGVTGFCRGGLYALLYAAHSPDMKAAVAWYGQIKPAMAPGIRTEGPLNVVSKINCPILMLNGEADAGIPVADVREMEAALKAAGKTVEVAIYPGAPHAFFADYRPSYRPEAAKDAWARCVAWFEKYLKG
jgi:carboxymethylenebutenolidase